MITKIRLSRQDIEETIEGALAEFNDKHNRVPHYIVLGRLAYEELRDMEMIGHRNEPGTQYPSHFKNLEIAVVEEPENMLAVGCKPD